MTIQNRFLDMAASIKHEARRAQAVAMAHRRPVFSSSIKEVEVNTVKKETVMKTTFERFDPTVLFNACDRESQAAYTEYVKEITKYLVPYFPTGNYGITLYNSPSYGILIRTLGGFSSHSKGLNNSAFPSCCGWTIYNGFSAQEGSFLTVVQKQAFEEALRFLISWSLLFHAPSYMAVFVSCSTLQTLNLSEVTPNKAWVQYQWALDIIMAIPGVNIQVLESRINSNSGHRINTISFNRPTLENIRAAWN